MNKRIYKLSPIVKEAIWGGKNIFNVASDKSKKIAELWEYVNLDQESNYILEFNNMLMLSDVIGKTDLPIVVKIINAELDLSVQVHPDKSEVLLVIDSSFDAKVAIGLNYDNLNDLKKNINNNNIEASLKYCSVQKGDVLYLPAGVPHAIGGGILALEVQNPKLTTYRIFDYNRKINGIIRELHVEEALQSIKTENCARLSRCDVFKDKGLFKFFSCEHYDVYVLNIEKESIAFTNPRVPVSIVCVAGEGEINNINVSFSNSFVCLVNKLPTFVSTGKNLTLIFATIHSNYNEITLI